MELDIPPKSRVYFDTNIFIYAIEDHEDYRAQIAKLYQHLHERECQIVTSELTYAECLVKPIREGDKGSIKAYEDVLLHSPAVQMCPVSFQILSRGAVIRADNSIKLPDAIHLATAVEHKCSYMISNDSNLCISNIRTNNTLLSDIS